MTADVRQMPASDTMTVEQTLAEAGKWDWSDVLVLGYVDGGLFWRTSKMSRAEAVFLLEMAKKSVMEAPE